jgi:hypothetical protein
MLGSAGFVMPVVDIDRVKVSYPSLEKLIRDIRRMGAGNILKDRPKIALTRQSFRTAAASFGATAQGGNLIETFEILYLAAWAPAAEKVDPALQG